MTIDRFLDIARSAVGITQDDAALQALCGPGETPEHARLLAQSHIGALFVRGCLATTLIAEATDAPSALDLVQDLAGLPKRPTCVPRRLWAPYVIGQAMADLRHACSTYAANYWERRRNVHALMRPGTIVIVGKSGHEHAYIVESIERDGWPDGSIALTAIEAGQVDAQGRQCVRRKRHEITRAGVDAAFVKRGLFWIQDGERRPVTWVLDPRPLLGPT